MADSGFNWDAAWSFVQLSAGNWDDDAVADNAIQVGDAVDMDVLAAMDLSIELIEDNTGAINGVVTVYVLGDIDGTNYEAPGSAGVKTIDTPRSWEVTPVQNNTVNVRFSILGSEYSKFKIAILNESGQELATSVRKKAATIPPAS